MIEAALADNPRLEWEVVDHYAYVPDEVTRANVQFRLLLRRNDTRAKLFAASRLTHREGFVADLAHWYGEPRKPDELGAIAHFLNIDPDQVESYVKRVNRKLRRRRSSSTRVA